MKKKATLQELNESNFREILTIISQDDAEKLYSAPELHAGYDDDEEISPVGLYKGNLHISALKGGEKSDIAQYKLIVLGDLIIDGIMDWSNGLNDSYVLVKGNLKAQNIILEGCCEVTIDSNVEVENCILCHSGEDGGRLTVGGTTKAHSVILTTYFETDFASQPEAIVICDSEGDYEYEADYQANYDEYDDDEEVDLPPNCKEILLLKYLSKEGGVNESAVCKAIKAGTPFLRK